MAMLSTLMHEAQTREEASLLESHRVRLEEMRGSCPPRIAAAIDAKLEVLRDLKPETDLMNFLEGSFPKKSSTAKPRKTKVLTTTEKEN